MTLSSKEVLTDSVVRQRKLDKQIAEFLSRGGEIEMVPVGVSAEMVKEYGKSGFKLLPFGKAREGR